MINKIQNVGALSLTNGLEGLSPAASASESLSVGSTMLTPGQRTGMNFGEVLGNLATDTVNSIKGAEAMSFKAIQGTANTREVVDAMLEAQQSLQTATALRDKIVTAYLEITKMQI